MRFGGEDLVGIEHTKEGIVLESRQNQQREPLRQHKYTYSTLGKSNGVDNR